mmetsp:Transcript_50346/g.151616  ORF Transcript_50346/g.151616 Transcript_50346/m.151616 type:complete len:244 (-) Transcript_50346:283-1014(-)
MGVECFDHEFSGLSVWLEPCPDEVASLIDEMESLSRQCGGPSRGLHNFAPHCTLLYNIANPFESAEAVSRRDADPQLGSQIDLTFLGKHLLDDCIREFEKRGGLSDPTVAKTLDPKSFFYFEYPKAADDGRGFGCVISMLLLENNNYLQTLHESAAAVFPPDERHSKSKGSFIPHMAMVYAPECEAGFLERRTKGMERTCRHLLKPLSAKYLTLWSTGGKLEDWYKIAQVELPSPFLGLVTET